MARVARRRRKSAKAIDAVREARAEAQRLADRRGVAYTRQALALLPEALAAMLTADVSAAAGSGAVRGHVAGGDSGAARGAGGGVPGSRSRAEAVPGDGAADHAELR